MTMQNESLTAPAPCAKIATDAPRAWVELRHPETNRFIGKYCPQSHQLLVVERGKRGVIELPKA